jgi:hypothetical protein
MHLACKVACYGLPQGSVACYWLNLLFFISVIVEMIDGLH